MTQTPASDGEQQMRQQVEALAGRFLKRTIDQVAAFREQATQFSQGNTDALQAVQDVAHKIHGSGAVFGFPGISEAAERLERFSDQVIKSRSVETGAAHAQHAQQLTALVEQLAAAVESDEDGEA